MMHSAARFPTPVIVSSRSRAPYVDWFNHRRLHSGITDDASYASPAEHEAAHYRQNRSVTAPITQ